MSSKLTQEKMMRASAASKRHLERRAERRKALIALPDGTMHEIGKPFTPNIEVIAQKLAYTNRYGGAAGTYSVAQHCVVVSRLTPRDSRLSGLLHDAPEAYLGDMVTPLKAHCPDFVHLEAFYHDVIDEYWGVDTRSKQVADADHAALVAEVKSFGLHVPVEGPWHTRVRRLRPADAKRLFLEQYHTIVAELESQI